MADKIILMTKTKYWRKTEMEINQNMLFKKTM